MKRLLLIFLMIGALKSFTQNTYIPDDNFEQALINLGYDSGPLDDYVPTANIETQTYLGLYSANVSDLTGLEDFKALEYFDCTGNPLVEIDLRKNTTLKSISISGNQLTSLDLRNGNNTILTPNISATPNLICIKVDDVSYANTNWKNKVSSSISFSLDCGKTYVPDDNFEKELIRLGYDSYPLDDYVQNVKIENVISLNISGKQVLDFTGIEGFTALKTLICTNNPLTTINVSKNVNLEKLYCYGNQLTSLDVSKNNALTLLRCDNNKLTQLNVKNGNNSNINNQGFNASRNPNLTCIEVDDVNYSSTTWFSKDTNSSYSNNCHFQDTYVPDDNFEQALIDLGYDTGTLDDYVPTVNINSITSLDIASKNIIDLTGIEAFIGLTSLDCSNNQIVNLDVSNNTSLVNLQVNNNLLEKLNFKNGVNNGITNSNFNALNNTNLTCIQVDDATYSTTNWAQIDSSASFSENCHYGMTYVPDDAFEQWLIYSGYDSGTIDDYVPTANINTLTTLSFYNKNITDLTGIEAFTALETLSLVRNNLVTVNLSNNKALTSLDLSQNQLTTLDLSNNSALISVNVSSNKLTGFNIKNGANSNISAVNFKTTSNTNLTCINVDDVNYATTNWTQIDAQTSFSLKCGFTYIPDDNFEQALIDLGYDTGALDDYVPDATIKTLTSLDVSSKSIANLTGIEDFVALTTLNISNNNLSSINLNANTSLENLDCSHNQLTSLDATLLTSLKTLVANNNQLTTIDLSKNTGLTNLTLNTNQLTNLDITKNTLLTDVSCNNNVITSLTMLNDNNVLANLDVNNNQIAAIDVSVLEALSVLNCDSNLITNLDISKNSNLTQFNASNNQLTFLNVKNGANNSISTANFNIVNNPNLTCVLVDDIAFTTSNWTNIDATTSFSLDCGLAFIPDDNFEKELIKLGYDSGPRDNYVPIANINGVTTLNLYGKFVSDLTGIEYFTALEDLNLRFNRLTNLDLSNNKELRILNCAKGQISNLDISKNTKLTSLDCSENIISNLDLSNNTALTSLISAKNRITSLDLSLHTVLNYFDCSDNVITSLVLPQNAPLTKIFCGKNKLTSLDVSTNTLLTNLNCSENDIVSLDLKNNTTLHHLNAEYNKLTSLELPKSIIKVDCQYNQLTTLDVSNTPAMIHLRCYNNQLTNLNVTNSKVIELKCNNNQLTSLNLTTTRVIELFASNNNLTKLNIKNGLNKGMDNGDFVVQNNPNLTCVQVDDATYSTNTWTRIDRQMSFNQDCPSLSIEDDLLISDILIYPNPTSNILNLKIENQQIKSVKVYSLLGKEVLRTSNKSGINKINISNLNIGIYFIQIKTDETSFTKKIIKK